MGRAHTARTQAPAPAAAIPAAGWALGLPSASRTEQTAREKSPVFYFSSRLPLSPPQIFLN